ncbi:MAG TPA: nitrogenase component 1 [Desulfosporosinus sp.]|nr:nitrogenase component 1 [Desulfosporosinus sp.]
MGLVDQKIPPIREDRLKAIEAFGGRVCDLVNHSGNGCLVNKKRGFSQTCNCQMGLALSMINTIPDIVIIKHGPVGCGNSSQTDKNFINGLKSRGMNQKPLIWVSTNLDENDIVNGGEARLREAIIKLDSLHRPAAIVVLTTCATGIIGDDVNEVVAQLQGQVNAKIILVHCEGFRTKISATAYDAVYHGIARGLELQEKDEERIIVDELDVLKREYDRKRTVNIFNAFSIGRLDELELERLLNALGLKVKFYPNFAHPDSFRELTNAALNISLCPTHDDYFLKFLEERFGMPYLIKNMPIGIENTTDWLLDVAKEFGLEEQASKIAEAEVAILEKGLEPFRSKLQRKKVFVTGGEIRVVVTAMLMKEFGCEIAGLRGHHYDQYGDDIYAKLLKDDPEIEVNIATTQTFELANLLKRAKPDLALAHSSSNIIAGKLGIPTLPIFSQGNYYFGYKGVFEVARRAVKALTNPSYQQKLQENIRLPYKAEWYERSPFAYISDY